MKYKITEAERQTLVQFQNMRIPSIFKTDATDRILFVEEIDFTICNLLLKRKNISVDLYNEIMENCECFIETTDVKEFDDYALSYYNLCLNVVEIMKKYQNAVL